MYGCGANDLGQLTLTQPHSPTSFTKIPFDDVIDVAWGFNHSLIATKYFLSFRGDDGSSSANLFITEWDEEIIKVFCGAGHSILQTTKAILGCGANSCGQLGLSNYHNISNLTRIFVGHKVNTIACGGRHTIILTDKGLFGCGSNFHGQLGLNVSNNGLSIFDKLTEIPFAGEAANIVCGQDHTIVWNPNTIYGCGRNIEGQLSFTYIQDVTTLRSMTLPDQAVRILDVSCGSNHTVINTNKGLYACG